VGSGIIRGGSETTISSGTMVKPTPLLPDVPTAAFEADAPDDVIGSELVEAPEPVDAPVALGLPPAACGSPEVWEARRPPTSQAESPPARNAALAAYRRAREAPRGNAGRGVAA